MNKTLALVLASLAIAVAQPSPSGQMKVNGKIFKITNAYGYAAEGFFDKKKDDTVVLLTDRPLTDGQIRDEFGIRRLAEDGKLNFVKATVNASGQLISFVVGSSAFKAIPSGGGTEHVFEGTQDGKTIAGKVRTKSEQQFFGTKYEYEVSFRVPVQARK